MGSAEALRIIKKQKSILRIYDALFTNIITPPQGRSCKFQSSFVLKKVTALNWFIYLIK